jgi:OOP family OmpA-OmpF porin
MNKSLLCVAAAVSLLATPGVQAQWYGGAAGGWSRGDYECRDLGSCDRTGTGYKLYAGYAFGGGLTLEALYFDWGKASAAGTLGSGASAVPAVYDEESSGWGLAGAYIMPLDAEWNAVFRGGLAYNEGKTTATLGASRSSDSFTGTYPYIGFGLGWNASPNLTFTAEADFTQVKFLDDKRANVGLLSFGARFTF